MVDRFQTESNFLGDLSNKRVFPYKFVSAVNTCKNSSPLNSENTHVAENRQ